MKKIKVGYLPLYIKLYDDSNPHYRDPMVDYMHMLIKMLESQGLEVVLADEVCRIKPEFDRAAKKFNDAGVSAVITQHLAYSPSLESIEALLSLDAPIIVFDTTPDYQLLKVANYKGCISANHGIHGVQDMCNLLKRNGKPYYLCVGHALHSEVVSEVVGMCRAAAVKKAFQTEKVGSVGGSFTGMGDFLVSDERYKNDIGVEVQYMTTEVVKEYLPKVTEEEIRSIIQEGAEDGEVQEVEQKIMGRVFSLGDRTVESIMTFRSELVWIDTAMTPEQIREQVNREPHNRYPVGEGSLDKLAGVVYLKDLFRHIDDPGFDIRNHLSPAKFFHEGAEVYSALEQLRSEQLGYGIVCDEFGVTRGIVTLKDIFEALVGEIPDSYEEPDIVRREDGSVLIDGQCPFYDFLAFFGAENAVPRNAYNTISGLVLDQLKHIPATGEKLRWNSFDLEIVDMDGVRIDKILVTHDQVSES